MTAALLIEPQWSAAARALVSGCVDLRGDEDLVALQEHICRSLGDDLYPAFLRVLVEVGRRGDHAARASVARALVLALRSGRLPSGRLGVWGGQALQARSIVSRSLGPLEYLCVWYSQIDRPVEEQRREFLAGAEGVMSLVEADYDARRLYCQKLQADALDPIEGAHTRAARRAMSAMATAWADGEGAGASAHRFLMELSGSAAS